jgi:hypothetical protein
LVIVHRADAELAEVEGDELVVGGAGKVGFEDDLQSCAAVAQDERLRAAGGCLCSRRLAGARVASGGQLFSGAPSFA